MMSRVKQRVAIGCPRSPWRYVQLCETVGGGGLPGVRMHIVSVALLHI